MTLSRNNAVGSEERGLPARSRRHPAAEFGVDFTDPVRFGARRCRGHGRMPWPTGWKPALPKGHPIGVAEDQLQPKLPDELKGKLPTAKQLADAVKGEMGRMK